MGRALFLLFFSAIGASANTVFLNGTEFCSTARDSIGLLQKHSPGFVSFITQDCARDPNALPRKGMEDSLVESAADCQQLVGPERWNEFVARWNEVYDNYPSYGDARLKPDEDPLVGAFCEGIKRSAAGQTFTFHQHAHGITTKERSLAYKSGEFHLDKRPYPGAALWAAQSLVPEDRRLVGLHENCFGESIMADMLFGPRKRFSDYRPGTCSVAASVHDRYHYSQHTEKRERRVSADGNSCELVKVPSKYRGTFLRNIETMKVKTAPSLAAYERGMIARAGSVFNLPITSSSSTLGLYYDLHGSSRIKPGDVNLASCALDRSFKIPFLAEIRARAQFDGEAARLLGEFRKAYKKLFGKYPSGTVNIGAIEKELSRIEADDPKAPFNSAFASLNLALAEQDKRNVDFEEACGQSIVPPQCKVSETSCTVKHLRENCVSVRSLAFREACRKLEKTPSISDSTPLSKLFPRKSCKSREPECLTRSDLDAEAMARVKSFHELNVKVESLRYLARLGKSINALDLMVTDLDSPDADRAATAQDAMRAYLGMLECEKGKMYQ